MDTIARWHGYMRTHDAALLDALIAEDCVFRSPAVHSPQVGKAITLKYLGAAAQVLGTADFRYTGEWRAEGSAVFEFESVVDGMTVNGVDIIDWDDDGRITGFKVMVRPMKGLNALVGDGGSTSRLTMRRPASHAGRHEHARAPPDIDREPGRHLGRILRFLYLRDRGGAGVRAVVLSR